MTAPENLLPDELSYSEKNNSRETDVMFVVWRRNESIILSPANTMSYGSVLP